LKLLKNNTDNFTFKNHYNPCFWTALWNSEYYHSIKNSTERNKKARDYKLKGIRFGCDKIIKNKADKLFYELHMGLAVISIMELREMFYKLPKDYIYISKVNKFSIKYLSWLIPNWGIIIDIEPLLRELERINGTNAVLDLVKHGNIIDKTHKSLLATFIYTQQLRSPLTFSANYHKNKHTNNPKAFSILDFIHSLSNDKEMYNVITVYLQCMWHLYTVDIDIFPLSDLTIHEDNQNVIAVLSPRHLLIINKEHKEDDIRYYNTMNKEILDLVCNKIIQNTFKDLVLENESVLNQILDSRDWKDRSRLVRSIRKT
jgi:hypothetical protein